MNIKDIKIDKEHNMDEQMNSIEKGYNVYQFQPIFNKPKGCLYIVGKMKNIIDIVIKSFKYNNNKCLILSCLYSQEDLFDMQKSGIFSLIKLKIFSNNKLKYTLSYNMHTFEHIKSKKNIIEYVSVDKSEFTELGCFYSIVLHTDEKMKYIDKFKNINSRLGMINSLVKIVPSIC
jgi:hypothetical protein